MPTVNKQFGLADPHYDALRVSSNQAIWPGPGSDSVNGHIILDPSTTLPLPQRINLLITSGGNSQVTGYDDAVNELTQIAILGDPSLSRYQNIVVVDAGGNGDYTTLTAAMAAIGDAAVNKRYGVFVFGATSEGATVICKDYIDVWGAPGSMIDRSVRCATATYRNLSLASNRYFYNVNAASPVIVSCLAGMCILDNPGTVQVLDCAFATVAINAPVAAYFSNLFLNSTGDFEVSYDNSGGEATIWINHAHIKSTGQAVVIVNTGVQLIIENSLITGTTGIRFYDTTPGVLINNCTIIGNPNAAIDSAGALLWSDAPIYLSVISGALTNITLDAGTPQGTCIQI